MFLRSCFTCQFAHRAFRHGLDTAVLQKALYKLKCKNDVYKVGKSGISAMFEQMR